MVLTAILPQTAPYKLHRPYPLLFTAAWKLIQLTENPQMPPKPLNNPYNAITTPAPAMSLCVCVDFKSPVLFSLAELQLEKYFV